jgi:hypothetical protein
MMQAVADDFYLSEEEIARITKYKRPSKQLAKLREMGIAATKLRDNTIRVLTRDVRYPAAPQQTERPKLKSSKR